MEGGTATVAQRLQALRKLAAHGYPVGVVIAPIMAISNWQQHYADLFQLITHRFTPKSKEVLETWYPKSKLDLEPKNRSQKRNKFGGVKYVYHKDTMAELQEFIEAQIDTNFPQAKILYWT